MNAEPQVRRATAEDIPGLLDLVEEYWRFEDIRGFDRERVAAQLERLLTHGELGGGWVALSGAEPVGYLLAVYVFSLEHLGLTAEIDELFVRPQHRGQGTGKSMLSAAEASFAAAGCTNASLQIAHGNDPAREFYRRCGYRERPGYGLLEKSLTDASRSAAAR